MTSCRLSVLADRTPCSAAVCEDSLSLGGHPSTTDLNCRAAISRPGSTIASCSRLMLRAGSCCLELDLHDRASPRRVVDQVKPGLLVHRHESGVVLGAQGTVVVDRVGLESRRAPFACEPHGGRDQRRGDTATPRPGPNEDARDSPDAGVRPLLVASCPGGHAAVADESGMGGAGRHGTPANCLATEASDQAGRRGGISVAAVRLGARAFGTLLDGSTAE